MITEINHITFSVKDLEKSFQFYRDVLGFKPLARWEKGAYLLAGQTWICLTLDLQTRTAELPEYSHIAFTVADPEFEDASHKIKQSGAKIWQENTSEGASLYFLDPDGHKLEIHASDWQARLSAWKEDPWEGLELFI